MFQLLQPIWLLAIAGISVPLLIHLWNVKRGKTLKIGSIALLRESARQTARSWKVTDLLLLVLRCLIIIISAMLLAQPAWFTEAKQTKQAGWILVEQQNAVKTYSRFKTKIDSLLKAGYELHYFRPGFPQVDQREQTFTAGQDSASTSTVSYWSLLTELDRKLNSERKVYLFTPNQLNRFNGTRPTVNLDLEWNTYTDAGHAQWLSKAQLIDPERILISEASSDSSATRHKAEIIPAAGNSDFGTTFKEGKLIVFPKTTSGGEIAVDSAPAKIAIYTDQFATDAGYLLSALEAIKGYTGENIIISYATSIDKIAKDVDWLFWLSLRQVPATLRARNRFIYQRGTPKSITSLIRTSSEISAGTKPASLYKRISAELRAGQATVWRDGLGEPLLIKQAGRGSVDYYFYNRLDPSWNDLPWKGEFPEVVHQLLFGGKQVIHPKDARKASQLLPRKAAHPNAPSKSQTAEFPLDRIFWAIVFVLFLLERAISFSRERSAHGT